jgi:predicted site-specific integrase-resolvase
MKRGTDDLLTSTDAARVAGVSSDCIRVWARTGVLPIAIRAASGLRLYRKVDVEKLVAARRKEPPGAAMASRRRRRKQTVSGNNAAA